MIFYNSISYDKNKLSKEEIERIEKRFLEENKRLKEIFNNQILEEEKEINDYYLEKYGYSFFRKNN